MDSIHDEAWPPVHVHDLINDNPQNIKDLKREK